MLIVDPESVTNQHTFFFFLVESVPEEDRREMPRKAKGQRSPRVSDLPGEQQLQVCLLHDEAP